MCHTACVKKCTECDEDVQDGAKVCRYYGNALGGWEPRQSACAGCTLAIVLGGWSAAANQLQ